jgi:hypothetical protein
LEEHVANPAQEQPDDEADARKRLMQEVADQMDSIETDFGDGFKIGRVITVVEVERPDGGIELRVRAGQYPWVAAGMLEWAKKIVEATPSDE